MLAANFAIVTLLIEQVQMLILIVVAICKNDKIFKNVFRIWETESHFIFVRLA